MRGYVLTAKRETKTKLDAGQCRFEDGWRHQSFNYTLWTRGGWKVKPGPGGAQVGFSVVVVSNPIALIFIIVVINLFFFIFKCSLDTIAIELAKKFLAVRVGQFFKGKE